MRAILLIFSIHLISGIALSQSIIDDVLDNRILRVGTTGDWDPMTTRDIRAGGFKGFDIDLLTLMADDLGVQVQFVQTDWKNLISGLNAGRYQITGSASVTTRRAAVAGFSDSYFYVETVPLVLRSNAEKYNAWEDFNSPLVTVAATLGTSHADLILEFFPNATHRFVEAPARDFQEVLTGRAEVHLTSNVEAARLMETYPELTVVPGISGRLKTPLAMLLPRGDQQWLNFVNTWIQINKTNRQIERIAHKWGLLN